LNRRAKGIKSGEEDEEEKGGKGKHGGGEEPETEG